MTKVPFRSLPCGSPADAQALINLVKAHITHPNQFQYKGRAFVSTFAGETCQFGQGSVADGWKTQFTQSPDLQGQIYFVPAFFIDPATFGNFAGVMDGDFNVFIITFLPLPSINVPDIVELWLAYSSNYVFCPKSSEFTAGFDPQHDK